MSVHKPEGKARSVWRAAVLFGGAAVYALLYALGLQIDAQGFTQLGTSLTRFFAALPVALCVLYALFRFVLPRLELKPDVQGKKPFCTLGAFALIFASYVPMFVIQYPGSFCYDSTIQMIQVACGEYSKFHPLLHTLLLTLCMSLRGILDGEQLCYALYSVIQMLLLSGSFALTCASLSRSVSRKAARIAVLFFILYPTHMVFASNCTKDVLFSGFLVLFLALCVEEIALGSLSSGKRAMRLVCGIVACLLRNNMIYAVAAWAAILLLSGKRFRRLLICAMLVVVTAHYGNTALTYATHAWNGSVLEMMSVPLLQLSRARLYEPQVFTPEEAALMDTIFEDVTAEGENPDPAYVYYNPTISDPVKQKMSKGIMREHMTAFWKLWAQVGMRCPEIYLDAFLNLALPSLYPYGRYGVTPSYLETGGDLALLEAYGFEPIERSARFQSIREELQRRIFNTGADDVPILRWVLNMGVLYWLLLLFLLFDLYEKRFDRVALLMLCVLLYGTYLLGPVMQARYAYPFMCMLPLFVLRPRNHLTGGNTDDI